MSSPTTLLTFSEGESERSHFSTAQESPRLVRPPRTHLFKCASLFPALVDGLASVGCYGGPLLSFVRLFVRSNLVNHRLHCLIPSLVGEISCVVVACECLLRRLSSRSVKASRSGLTSQRHKRVLGWFDRQGRTCSSVLHFFQRWRTALLRLVVMGVLFCRLFALFVRSNLVNHRLHCLIPSLVGEISCVVVACECLLRRLSSRSVKASRSGLTSQRHKRVLGWFDRQGRTCSSVLHFFQRWRTALLRLVVMGVLFCRLFAYSFVPTSSTTACIA